MGASRPGGVKLTRAKATGLPRNRIVHRPAHGVTVAQVFRALTLEPELLPSILAADDLLVETRARALEGRMFRLDLSEVPTDLN